MDKKLSDYSNLSRWPLENHVRRAMVAGEVRPRPGLHPIAIFLPSNFVGWLKSYLKFIFGSKHRFVKASETPGNSRSFHQVADTLRLGIAGDWGTGTDEAYYVAAQMMAWDGGELADLTIHLGDVYFVGDDAELRQNCLGGQGTNVPPDDCVTWPLGRSGSFALNGNHEMYANGNAYFDTFLPALGMRDHQGQPAGQGPSFFCLENKHWRLIGIDTGYNSVGRPLVSMLPGLTPDCRLPDELIRWLREDVRPHQRPKGTILISHHQYFSAFEGGFPRPAAQLKEFFGGTPILWLWGHEHRLAGYKLYQGDLTVHGRCIGHGGMPVAAKAKKSRLAGQLLFWDERVNPNYAAAGLGYNGFLQMTLQNEEATLTYFSLALDRAGKGQYGPPQKLLTETFAWDGRAIHQTGLCRHLSDPDFHVVAD